jgi:hypothetical protein
MRRRTAAVALALIATVLVAGPASARPGAAGASRAVSASRHTVTKGSTWTLYYFGWQGGTTSFCEEFSFGVSHTFTGDKGDNGVWSGAVNMAITYPGLFQTGDVYHGKMQATGPVKGSFLGTLTSNGIRFAPFVLSPGKDPLSFGSC